MQTSRRMTHVLNVILPLGVWVVICALIASNAYMRRPADSTRTWLWSFADQCGFYLPFVLVSVAMIYASRWQLKRGMSLGQIIRMHVAGSLFWMAGYSCYAIAWFMWMRHIDWAEYGSVFTSLHGINSLSDYAVYWIIATVIYSWRFFQQVQQHERAQSKLALQTSELETQLALSKLETLKSQLQPHFLFNALNSISTLFRTGENQKGLKTLSTLSDLLRLVLQQDQRPTVPLRKELELINLYLEIEKVRFAEHLVIERHIDPQTLDLHIPVMLLQPLVENAVRHGISQNLNPGTLKISTALKGSKLAIEIVNHGPPLAENKAKPRIGGKGLAITRERLKKMYGDQGAFCIENVPDQGVRVALECPASTQPVGIL